MTSDYDPYRKWLGIPPEEQPANHYRLLGIRLFEDDPEVISNAADRQMAHVRSYQTGRHSELSQKVLNELSAARVCLLTPEKKQAYDDRVRAQLAVLAQTWTPAGPPFEYHLRGALRYVWIQAERCWLRAGRLPFALAALGRAIQQQQRRLEPLWPLQSRLEQVTSQLALLRQPPADEPAPGLTAKLKRLARRVKDLVQAGLLALRQWRLQIQLGRGAFKLQGDASGPPELVTPVRQTLSELDRLRHDSLRLADVPPHQFLSPKRLAWIIIAVVIAFWLLIAWVRS